MGSSVYLLPHQERFLQSPFNFKKIRWHFLLGGYGCISGDTEIETTEGRIKVKDFKGGRVFALDKKGKLVTAKASSPVKYKSAPLYKVELDNGKSIICTKEHTLLTPDGWKKVSELNPGVSCVYCVHPQEFSDDPPHSSSDTCPSAFSEDVPCLKKTTQDSQGGYPVCCRLCDERLLWAINSVPTSVPSQDDARGHSRLQRTDGQASESEHNQSCPDVCLRCKHHSKHHKHLHALRAECHNADKVSECTSGEHPVSAQSLLNSDLQQSVHAHVKQVQEPLPSTFCDSYSYETSLVTNITYVEDNVYYDLNVPGLHNYIAGGMVHHNCGKTTCLVFAVLHYVSMLQNVKDNAGKYARIMVGGYTYAHLEQTFMIDFLSYLDSSKTPYRNDTKNHIMYIGTVEVIFVQLSEPDRIFGQSVYVAALDEADELPEDTMIEAMKSVSQRCRQKLPGQRSCHIIAASTAQGYKGFYRLYTHYKKAHIAFVLIRAWTEDNIYLPPEYIEDLKKSFTPTELEVFMHGEFLSVAQGRVIPGFDWKRNFENDTVYNMLAPGTRVFIGMDFNSSYNRASAWVSMPDKNGVYRMCCVKYYDFPDPLEAPNVFRYDFPEQDLFWIPDVTSKDSFPQFAKALRQNNVHIIYRKKSPLVEDSCFFISSMCYQGRVVIYEDAATVAEAFAQASRDKNNKIPKGVGPSSPIHAIDGARYATSYMGLVLPEYRDVRRSLMSHIATYRSIIEDGDAEEQNVRDLGAGYTQIEGQAYLE